MKLSKNGMKIYGGDKGVFIEPLKYEIKKKWYENLWD